jgi:Ca-activated chloride channel family protein
MNFLNQWGVTFVNPWLLMLLLLVPLVAFLLGNRGGVPAVVFSSTAPLKTLGRMAESKAGEFLTGLMFLALALLIIALARPQQGKTISHVEASGIDIMIAIDVSGSMVTEDYYDDAGQRVSRIDEIKDVTRKFIEARPNDRIGIIAFGTVPYLVSPLTLDHDWLLENLDRVKIGLVADNTAIGSAIAASCLRLKDRESKSKVIILLTDGDNNSGKVSPDTAAEAAKALGIKLYAIGAGTNGMAWVPNIDGRTMEKIPDIFGNYYHQEQVHFNEEGLQKVARIASGKYYRADSNQALEGIFAEIDKMEKSKAELTMYKQYRDLYPWFLMAGLGILSMQLVLSQTIWRKLP